MTAAQSKLRAVKPYQDYTFSASGSLRQDLSNGGRVHVDRPLPFLIVNRFDEDNSASLSHRVATTSPAYVVWPAASDNAEGVAATKAVLAQNNRSFASNLVISVYDLPAPEASAEDTPSLPEFRAVIGTDGTSGGKAAARMLERALCDIDVDMRHCQVDRTSDWALEPSLAQALSDCGCAHVSLGLPQVHFQSDGKSIYPLLFHDLAVGVFDALLKSAYRFIESEELACPVHHRALGRRTFLDAASKVDAAIDRICGQFDFLMGVSPINSEQAFADFQESGGQYAPTFRYRPLSVDPDQAKRELYSIDFRAIEDPVLETLFSEKRHELDHQLTMLDTRNTPRFRFASLMLYETVDSELRDAAKSILAAPKRKAKGDRSKADCHEIADAARRLVSRYHQQDECFDAKVEIRDDLSPGMMVSGSRLYIGSSTMAPRNRIEPLLHHEVSIHLLTYFNGESHDLEIFKNGLAGYEGIQEGLAVFAEWAVGGLTNSRLRLLAGRVLGVDAMIDGASFVEVYRMLHDQLGFSERGAFSITARIFRSGGLAKDAIYLRGFKLVLDILVQGGDLTPFWYGKIAKRHVGVVQDLAARGLLKEPRLRPEFLNVKASQDRIAAFRDNPDFSTL
ncbi:flavohemoglobin expression-modulating QEGLA motif protein [Qipengyuania marisflavi]|nr:flavohemoglobin expression-modulating QEGLA motif protein [Qipengyuania marisflavi]